MKTKGTLSFLMKKNFHKHRTQERKHRYERKYRISKKQNWRSDIIKNREFDLKNWEEIKRDIGTHDNKTIRSVFIKWVFTKKGKSCMLGSTISEKKTKICSQ